MLQGQRILITGGSSGLGLALAKRLATGNRLALVARNRQKLDEAVAAIMAETPGARVTAHAIDVASPDSHAALQRAATELGGVDLLINSAGILREGYFSALADTDFRDIMDINFFGTVNAIRALLPLLQQSRGRILNIASIAGLTGVFGYTAYCSSKFALIGFSEALHFELAPQGIRVQVACPPEFDSPMVDALDLARTPENRAHAQTIPKLSLEQTAAGVLDGLNSDRLLIIPGTASRLLAFGLRHFPALSRWIGRQRIRAATGG